MPDKKTAKNKVQQAKKEASSTPRFSILRMPEEKDDSPHWLFSLLIIVMVALAITLVWETLSVGANVQAYLPYL